MVAVLSGTLSLVYYDEVFSPEYEFSIQVLLCTMTNWSESRIWILQYTRCHIHKLWWWYCQVLVCTTKYSVQNMNFAFKPAFRPAGTLVYYDKVFRVQNMNFAPPSLVGESRLEASAIISTLSLNQYVHIDTIFSKYYFFPGKIQRIKNL